MTEKQEAETQDLARLQEREKMRSVRTATGNKSPIQKHRRDSWRTIRVAESLGYACGIVRDAPYHVLAVSGSSVLLIHVCNADENEQEEIAKLAVLRVPPGTRRLVHRWVPSAQLPEAQEL
jgi:hypothetical protein